MQLWRPRETPSGPFPASTWDAHFPGNQEAGREREGEASKAWEEETVASNTVALYLARFYGKTCCHATSSLRWGQTAFICSQQPGETPSAFRMSTRGYIYYF